MLMQVKGKGFQSCLLKGLQVDVRSLGDGPARGPRVV